MDVLLIKPYSELVNTLPPAGLGFLSSALKKEGISTKIIHCKKDNLTINDIIKIIKDEGTKIIGVTCCSNDHLWVDNFAKEITKLSDIFLVVGGPHATGLSKRLIELIPRINFLIQSEGEIAFPVLVKAIKNGDLTDDTLSKIPNLIWKNSNGDVIQNPIELPLDLDEIGFPDWEQLAPQEYSKYAPHGGFAKTPPVAQLITTRGCPYACHYCAASVLNGRKIRRRSPQSIIKEIQYLITYHNIREIHIEDDNFTFYKDHVVNLCTEIRNKGIKLNFGLPNGVRVDRLDDDILSELKHTGFYFLSIGIESGCHATLRRMNKALDLQKVRDGIKLIKKYDFRLKGFFMIGYPGETRQEILETIDFANSLGLDQAFFSIYIPLPGTKEFNKLEEEGYLDITKCDWESYCTQNFRVPPYIPQGMTADELRKMVSYAYRSFYFRPKQLFNILKNITSISQIKHLVNRGKILILKSAPPLKDNYF